MNATSTVLLDVVSLVAIVLEPARGEGERVSPSALVLSFSSGVSTRRGADAPGMGAARHPTPASKATRRKTKARCICDVWRFAMVGDKGGRKRKREVWRVRRVQVRPSREGGREEEVGCRMEEEEGGRGRLRWCDGEIVDGGRGTSRSTPSESRGKAQHGSVGRGEVGGSASCRLD